MLGYGVCAFANTQQALTRKPTFSHEECRMVVQYMSPGCIPFFPGFWNLDMIQIKYGKVWIKRTFHIIFMLLLKNYNRQNRHLDESLLIKRYEAAIIMTTAPRVSGVVFRAFKAFRAFAIFRGYGRSFRQRDTSRLDARVARLAMAFTWGVTRDNAGLTRAERTVRSETSTP